VNVGHALDEDLRGRGVHVDSFLELHIRRSFEALWQRIMLAATGKIEIGATATQKVMYLKQPN